MRCTIGRVLLIALGMLTVCPWLLHAQTHRELITESTATVGRGGAFPSNDSFQAEIVAVADLGVRWTKPSGLGFGVSILGGRDFPNEASLAGVRGRISQEIGEGMLEGSVAAVSSSLGAGGIGHARSFGAIVSGTYYPRRWFALTIQADMVPTARWTNSGAYDPDINRDPVLSAGLRLADKPGILPWIGAGLAALSWLTWSVLERRVSI